MAFLRMLDGRTLRFAPAADFPITDVETGTRRDVSGRAVAGPWAGRRLEFVPTGIEKWYAWFAYHPSTEVYQAPPEQHGSAIQTHLVRGWTGDGGVAPDHLR